MMKQIIILTLLLFSLLGCSQEKSVDDGSLVEKDVPQEKQITYGIEPSIFQPFELYFNDVKIRENYNGWQGAIEVNNYALKNGVYKIKLIIYPTREQSFVNLEDLKNTQLYFAKVIFDSSSDDGSKEVIQRDIIKQLPLKIPTNTVKKFEQTWEVEITDLPYELTGWSKSRDLRKMDSIQLKKQVVAYYQKLWNILNEGDADAWTQLTRQRTLETRVFDYTSKEEMERLQNINYNIPIETKGNILPLEDYTLQLYANGRLVRLERKATKKYHGYELNLKGLSPLINEFDEVIYEIPITLHMPPAKKSLLADEPEWDDFEIIRK